MHKELTFHIKLDSKMSLKSSHDIVSNIEKNIFNKLGIYTTIHADPDDN